MDRKCTALVGDALRLIAALTGWLGVAVSATCLSLLSREILPKCREHRPSSLLISVYFQWFTTSSRPLTEQGETWGVAGKNRENLEPLQGGALATTTGIN